MFVVRTIWRRAERDERVDFEHTSDLFSEKMVVVEVDNPISRVLHDPSNLSVPMEPLLLAQIRKQVTFESSKAEIEKRD